MSDRLPFADFQVRSDVLKESMLDGFSWAVWFEASEHLGHAWFRVSAKTTTTVTRVGSFSMIAATAIKAKKAKLLARLFPMTMSVPSWQTPNGMRVEQVGNRESDLILAWKEANDPVLDEANLRIHWPEARRVQQLGDDFYVVFGAFFLDGVPIPEQPGEAPSIQVAKNRVATARSSGRLLQLATALTDLGALYLHSTDLDNAQLTLREAVVVARQSGNKSAERDALDSLGKTWLKADHLPCAQQVFQRELDEAREQQDRISEKLALGWLAVVSSTSKNFEEAVRLGEEALRITTEVGDRMQQVRLLQQLSIDYAELGRVEEAVARGEAALHLHLELGTPGVEEWSQSLARFRQESNENGAFVGIQTSIDTKPGILRMASSAMKAALGLAGTGFKIATKQEYQARLAVCATCPQHTGMRCKVCGCFTSVKAWLPHEDCPLGHWPTL